MFLDETVLRMFERILVVLGGTMTIFLGYRLFSHANLTQDSTGSFKAKVFEVTASKIGPGVFFAGFGTLVLWTSLTHWFAPNDQPQPLADAQEISALRTIADAEQQPESKATLLKLIKRLEDAAN
jgi:hypothetical protein